MSLNLFLDSVGGNTVVALAKEKKLIEYHVEKSTATQTVGNIYKGRVENVLSGMQAAFIDVGLAKNGYLFIEDTLIDKTLLSGGEISSSLNIDVGDFVMVQVVKDQTATKGVRLTKYLSLTGKYVVYSPMLNFCSVSRKITDEETRKSLTKILSSIKVKKGGFIARTASENVGVAVIKAEAKILVKRYEEVCESFKTAKVGEVIYTEADLIDRSLRDALTTDVEKIIVGDKAIYERLLKLPKSRLKLKKKLQFFSEKADLFKTYGLDGEIESLLHGRVNLDSGAYIIIDRTEALTVIDVNTGSFIGSEDLEKTAYQTNLLAAEEIARQVRIRNISGIIIVDFIDMESEDYRKSLVKALEEHLKKDRLKCNVVGMTGLGIVEFTRTKKRNEISSLLNKPCPYCKGEGKILSEEYMIMKIRTAVLDLFKEDYKHAIIDLNEGVCNYIIDSGKLLSDVSKFFKDKCIYLIPHKTYHHEYFKILGSKEDVLNITDKAILLC